MNGEEATKLGCSDESLAMEAIVLQQLTEEECPMLFTFQWPRSKIPAFAQMQAFTNF